MISESRFWFTGFVTLVSLSAKYPGHVICEGTHKFGAAYLLASSDEGKTWQRLLAEPQCSTPLSFFAPESRRLSANGWVYFATESDNGFIEWMTVVELLLSGVACFVRLISLRKQWALLFLCAAALFGLSFLLGGGEEVSWEQRIFRIDSPDLFTHYHA